MKRLVIDCSAIRTMNAAAFAGVKGRFKFLVTGDVKLELYTHLFASEASDVDAANRDAAKHLRKLALNSNSVAHTADPFRYEAKHGVSARSAPLAPLSEFVPGETRERLGGILHLDDRVSQGWSYAHPAQSHDTFEMLRKLSADNELWPTIAECLWHPRAIKISQEAAVAFWWDRARSDRFELSGNFYPQTDWVNFGRHHMLFAYWIWKYARHGDGTPGKKQAVNAAYDMRYPAYVAICDGLLACDAEVLNMTWACWPAKRAGIYTYDKAKGGVVPYRPSWEAQGAETAG